MECQPCKEQNKSTGSKHWCVDCEEALCDDCYVQHRSFKISKNHTLKDLSECGVEKSVVCSENEWLFCREHSDKPLEYHCKTHDVPICLFCKRNYHKEQCDVEKIDDSIDTGKVDQLLRFMVSMFDDEATTLDTKIDSMKKHVQLVEEKCNSCKSELETTRIKVLIFFTEECLKITEELKSLAEKERTELNARMIKLSDEATEKLQEVTRLQNICKDGKMPLEKLYLILFHLKNKKRTQEHQESELLLDENMLKQIDKKLAFEKTSDGFKVCCIGNNANLSHIDEKNIKTTAFESIKEEKQESLMQTSCQLESSSSVIELESDTPLGQQHDSCDTPGKLRFQYISSFYVEKRNKDISLGDMKLLSNNAGIVMTECSGKRLLIYRKNGQKRGEIQLHGEPNSLAIIDNDCVAVSVPKMQHIAIINITQKCYISLVLNFGNCYGISFHKDNFLVSSVGGLKRLSSFGNTLDIDRNMAGLQYLYLDDENLYSSKRDTNSICVTNMKTKIQSNHFLRNLEDPVGLVVDQNGHLYVSCAKTDSIYLKTSLHSSAVVVLNQNDGINEPMSIDYDRQSNELIVVNNCRRSIHIFKRL